MKLRWRFGLAAAIFLAIFSLYPQMKLWHNRGAEWQGNYAYNDIDEVAYASYVKALVDGRPRKNDPYTGRDDSTDTPQKESLFSIQFAAPYTLAIPGRLLSIPTPWLMTMGGAVAAFLTALAIFWFLFNFTSSNWYAMAGSLVTLAGGAIFAGEGAISEMLFDGFSYPYFPGFRRYIPALAMPAIFGLIGLVWKLLYKREETETEGSYSRHLLISASVVVFAYSVFSYFYIWTTAVAWLGCVLLCWLAFRPDGFRKDIRNLVILGFGCFVTLTPYAYLLSQRSHTMDDVQLLVRTHAPDLTRFPEYVAGLVLLIVIFGISIKRLEIHSRHVSFVISLALAVIAVFNQQVITGQSLQPIHYQVFIGNYIAGLALVSALGLFVRAGRSSRTTVAKFVFASLTCLAVAWGFAECHYTVRVLDDANIARDEQVPVGRRLTELATNDPNRFQTVVLNLEIAEADDLPTLAPQATLWSRHQHVFTSVTTEENKERYYQYLYYRGVTGQELANSIKHGDFVSMIALFGWGRHTDRLNSDFKPLTYGEVDAEAKKYTDYIAGFNPRQSPETIVTYLVVRDDDNADLSNFDRWYLRDAGERLGPFVLYHVILKPVSNE